MHYFVDGYNLLFRSHSGFDELRKQREIVIDELAEQIETLGLAITLVFDATYRFGDVSRGHKGAMEIVYTSHGETADSYIVNEIESTRERNQETVVTSDRSLGDHCRRLGAKTMNVEGFVVWLNARYRRKLRKKMRPPKLTSISPTLKKVVKPELPKSPEESYLAAFEKSFQEITDAEEKVKAAKIESSGATKPAKKAKKKRISNASMQEPESDSARWQRIFESKIKKSNSSSDEF